MSTASNKTRKPSPSQSQQLEGNETDDLDSPTDFAIVPSPKDLSPTESINSLDLDASGVFKSLTLSQTEEFSLRSPERRPLRKIRPLPYLNRNDPLIKEFGLARLCEDGYINSSSNGTPDPGFGYTEHTTPAVAYRMSKLGLIPPGAAIVNDVSEELYIHPIFGRDMWETRELASPSEPHWDALKPVWQLATLLLEEKVMSGYIIGMLDRSSHTEIELPVGGRQAHWFETKKNPTKAELWLLYEDLYELKDCIRWAAQEIDNDEQRTCFGTTKADSSVRGLGKYGVGSKIYINENMLSILVGQSKPSDWAEPWTPGTDDASARLRLQWSLATTLCHELMHALWFARHGTTSHEPFYYNTRFAELGWQWEALLYGGATYPISDRCEMPYGLCTKDWPGAITKVNYPQLTHLPDSPGSNRGMEVFPVKMDWVKGFWNHEFWRKVQRYGVQEFRCPRLDEGVFYKSND